MSRPANTSRVALVAVSTVALVLSGCGGGDEPAPAEAIAAAPPTLAQPVAMPREGHTPVELSSSGELAGIRREVAVLRNEVAHLQQRLNQAGLRTSDASPLRAADALEVAQAEPERLARMEAEFRSEPSNPAWSRSSAARVHAAVAQIGDGVAERVRSLECRSRSCRIEIAPDESQPMDDTLPRIVAQLGEAFTSANGAHVDQGDGRQAGVLFLAH